MVIDAEENDRIRDLFCEFIEKLKNEIDERLLLVFAETSEIYQEMMFLDPIFTQKTCSENQTEIHISKLCEINRLPETATVLSVLNFSDLEDLDEGELIFVIEAESDAE